MKIVKERSRLIFSDCSDRERADIRKLVSTIDNTFIYEDEFSANIYLPVGMESAVKKVFRKPIEDRSNSCWDAMKIKPPIGKFFEPRNQMQVDSINFTLAAAKHDKKVGLILPPGSGKALANSTKLPTPTGITRMGDIQVGDSVFGSDGKPTTVTAVYPQGERDIYRVTFNDDRVSLCDRDHLWNVFTDDMKQVTKPLREIMAEYNGTNKCRIPVLSEPVEYQSTSYDVDPYVIGSMSANRSIPDPYMVTSSADRLKLLRGLMDIDGIISCDNERWYTTYNSYSMELLEQMQYLIRSFGHRATISTVCNVDDWPGTLIIDAPFDFHRQLFSNPDERYKSHRFNPSKGNTQYQWLTITDIQYSHREEATCITVAADDHLFLAEDFIVTHNTYVACYCAVKVGLRTLMIAPTTGVRDQWADSLTTMMKVDPSRVKMITSAKQLIDFDGDFAITLQATMAGMIKNFDVEKLIRDKRFGTKIIDETHMFFNNIIRVDGSMNVQHNWYLTATFGRSNAEEDALYHQMFGDINLFRVADKTPTIFNRKPGDVYGQKPHMNVEMIWMNGGLTRQQIGSIANATRYGISLPRYTSLIIPSDGTRTKFIDKLISVVRRADKKTPYGRTLILTPTISSVEQMAIHLRKEFPGRKIGTIHSKNDKVDNERVKAEDDIIISTVKSSGTGFDVKDLSKLIVAEQFKSAILAEQVSGRLRRRSDGTDTAMYDITDRSIAQLRAWGAARANLLKRKSKKFTVVNM